MTRRTALCALLGFQILCSSASEARAQAPGRAPVIGLLDAGERLEWWAAFRQQMRELGYVEGQNVAFEARYARGEFDQLPTLAQDLVRSKVAAIVTSGRVAAQAALRATATIPIVMGTGDDPVASGLVPSFGRPGGNLTGVTTMGAALVGKRVELLRETMPRLSRVAVLWHRDNGPSDVTAREAEAVARSSKLAVQLVGIDRVQELEAAFAAMAKERAGAVFVAAGPVLHAARHRVAELALKRRLPSVFGGSDYVDAGGMLSYAPSYPELFRRAALYVDKILKGAKPADLPIEQPTQVSLIVNLKTARALGVTIPQPILLRAERVTE